MKIMVFDVPADSGGALTILNQYYDKAVKDTENEWIFIISTPILKSKMNVKVVNFPWVKKSWFHRLYFDIGNPYLEESHRCTRNQRLLNKRDLDGLFYMDHIILTYGLFGFRDDWNQ